VEEEVEVEQEHQQLMDLFLLVPYREEEELMVVQEQQHKVL
jgi:hypothetical protein